jgi:hypothetical protein
MTGLESASHAQFPVIPFSGLLLLRWKHRRQILALGAMIRDVRRIRQSARLLMLLCASLPAAFPQDQTRLDNDIRTIYSWVIDHLSGTDKLSLIAPETYPMEYPQEQCLQIPREQAADFREIRADYDRRKNTTRQIPKPLANAKLHVILDPDVAQQLYLHSSQLSQSPIVRERYPGAEYMWLFSDVYFNRKRNAALLHANRWCGGLCGQPMWIAFEKGKDGAWQMRPWARGCLVVVEMRPALRRTPLALGPRGRDPC